MERYKFFSIQQRNFSCHAIFDTEKNEWVLGSGTQMQSVLDAQLKRLNDKDAREKKDSSSARYKAKIGPMDLMPEYSKGMTFYKIVDNDGDTIKSAIPEYDLDDIKEDMHNDPKYKSCKLVKM